MKMFFLCLAVILTFTKAWAMDPGEFNTLTEQIAVLQESGRLAESDASVRKALSEHGASLTADQKQALEYEIERSRRIREDYSVTEEDLFRVLKEALRDLTNEEIRAWESEGRFDFKMIDGSKMYVGPSRANLFFRYPELRDRRIKPAGNEWEQFLWADYLLMKKEWQPAAQGTMSPRNFMCRMSITVKANNVDSGKTIRCWMPFPQQLAEQNGVSLNYSSPAVSWINNPEYPARSLYFEQASRGSEPTVFEARYHYSSYPRHYVIDADKVTPPSAEMWPQLEYFTRENAPHVVFTPEIKALAQEIAGDEKNPYLRAQKYYDWISANIKYSYAREYSTLRNISMYTLTNRYGDCGQITLLFMTLCRESGIPARWQSGWMIFPPLTTLHDWCEIYIEPYGWIPVDVNFGVDITRGFKFLAEEEHEELRRFYFGGLDAYRLIVNSDHGYPHYPAKADSRSDDVDFQRGEVESEGKNIYFGRFRYSMDVEYLSPLPEYGKLEGVSAPAATPAGPSAPGLVR